MLQLLATLSETPEAEYNPPHPSVFSFSPSPSLLSKRGAWKHAALDFERWQWPQPST